MGELEEEETPKHLLNILGEYLSYRKIEYNKGKLVEITA